MSEPRSHHPPRTNSVKTVIAPKNQSNLDLIPNLPLHPRSPAPALHLKTASLSTEGTQQALNYTKSLGICYQGKNKDRLRVLGFCGKRAKMQENRQELN